jgi:ABC-2 type transport system ATP-binding protein
VDEVINSSNLTTWLVEGTGLAALADDLHDIQDIDQVASLGNTLHVVGREEQVLAAACARVFRVARVP